MEDVCLKAMDRLDWSDCPMFSAVFFRGTAEDICKGKAGHGECEGAYNRGGGGERQSPNGIQGKSPWWGSEGS